jgi:hypothetical protein
MSVMHARFPLRLARSAAFAVVCVTLAALGHWLADGSGTRPSAVFGGGAAVLVAAVALAGRERSPVVIGGFLVAAQVLLHELFTGAAAGGALTNLAHGQGLSVDLGMIIAHLTATLITGWWLARGEAALWSILRRAATRAARRLFLLLGVPPVQPRRPSSARHARVAAGPAGPRILRHAVIRRGPPLLLAF